MNIFIVVLFCFMSAMLIVGFISAKKKEETLSDYFVAGRQMNIWIVAGTYGASFMSAGTFLGTIGYNFAYGWAALWQVIGTITALFLLAILLAKKFWRFGYYYDGYTMPDVIAHRYPSKWARGIYAIIILTIYVVGMAAMYMGFYTILSLVSGFPYLVCVIIGAVVVAIYTYSGGARAVAWTDTMCMFVMLAAMLILVPACLHYSGGFEALVTAYGQSPIPEGTTWQGGAALLSKTNSYLIFPMSFAWFMVWTTGNMSQPHQVTRMYLAKNEKTAIGALALVMIPFTFIYIGGVVIANYARVLNPYLPRIDSAFPSVALSILPPLLAAIVLMGVIAAIISTCSTMLIIASQCTSYDIYKKLINPEATDKEVLKISRATIIICSILSIVIAYFAQTITGLIFLWSSAFAMMGAGVLPSLIGAFYWKRANVPANLSSMIVGFGYTAAMYLFPALRPAWAQHPILPGLILSTVVFIIVALLTKKPDKEVIDKFFGGQP